MYSVQVVFFPYFRKCALSKLFVESCAGRAINEVKAKNVLPFGQHSHKRTQTRYYFFTKHSERCEKIAMASLTYLSFIRAKGLIRGLSPNSSNIAFEVTLTSK